MNDHPIIIFDGICNLCNGAINFVIRQDTKNKFRFATLQSPAGELLLKKFHLPHLDAGSFVLIDKGKAYQQSTAALRVMNYLPWYWKEVQIFRIVPAFLRNSIYDFIAQNRYQWFGKKAACMVPTPDIKSRFLEEIDQVQ